MNCNRAIKIVLLGVCWFGMWGCVTGTDRETKSPSPSEKTPNQSVLDNPIDLQTSERENREKLQEEDTQQTDGESIRDLETRVMSYAMREFYEDPLWRQQHPEYVPIEIVPAGSEDPADRFLLKLLNNEIRYQDVSTTCGEVEKALETQYESLAFAALLWRQLMMAATSGDAVKRSKTNSEEIARVLKLLKDKTDQWSKAALSAQLNEYEKTKIRPEGFNAAISRGGLPPDLRVHLGFDTQYERYGQIIGMAGVNEEKARNFNVVKWYSIELHSTGKMREVLGASPIQFGIFDVLEVPLTVKGKVSFSWLSPWARPDVITKHPVALPAGAILTYLDILKLSGGQDDPSRSYRVVNPTTYRAAVKRKSHLENQLKDSALLQKERDDLNHRLRDVTWGIEDFWMF